MTGWAFHTDNLETLRRQKFAKSLVVAYLNGNHPLLVGKPVIRARADHRGTDRGVLAGHYDRDPGRCPQTATDSGEVHRKDEAPEYLH
jgi:hypothetical protein